MTTALQEDQRSQLEFLIQRARGWLERDLSETLEGRFGIHPDGNIEGDEALSLPSSQLGVRADLVEIIRYLRSEGEDDAGSVSGFVREAAFTHLNRLIAIRVAEGTGTIPPTLKGGVASTGFRDFREVAPSLADTDWGAFVFFVNLCADEFAHDVPALFDPRNPMLELSVSEPIVEGLIKRINALPDNIWAAPDTLGWTYQFFNSGEERRQMRQSSAPRTSRELAVRNQFFTPRYVVDFLIQNGLGAHFAAGFPELVDEMPLLVEVPTEQHDIQLSEVSVLDPACGSGHFLLGAYDLMEKAWQLAGVEPAEAAPHIVGALWGIDIDPRATQIAQAALILRARRHCGGLLPRPNVICARALPSGPETETLIATLPDHVGRAVRAVQKALVDAAVLGPLLKVEKTLTREVRDIFGTGQIEGTLSQGAPEEEIDAIRADVLSALHKMASSAKSTASQRLFVAEAEDAVRFVDALTRRYTAVLMNPPFGEPLPSTKPYLKKAYPWIPSKDHNLLAAFVGRGLELAQEESGSCGAITSRAGMFLKTYEAWRKRVFLQKELIALADLGHGVMEQALVEAAAYVLRNNARPGTGVFLRLLREINRPTALEEAIRNHRGGKVDIRVFPVELQNFDVIPGSPLAYWISNSIRRLWKDLPSLEEHGGSVRQGLASGDNFRFVRACWEVDPQRIGYSADDTQQGQGWIPFAKGGVYSPYWADIHLVVDWHNDGEQIGAFQKSVIRSRRLYFRPGLTWPTRTNSSLGFRILPSGAAFAVKGSAVIPMETVTPFALLGWLQTRLSQAMMEAMVASGGETSSGGPARDYGVGLVKKLSWLDSPAAADIAERMVRKRAAADETIETTRRFVRPPLSSPWEANRHISLLEDGMELDRLVNQSARLDEEGLRYLDQEIGPYPLSYPERQDLDERIADLYLQPVKVVIGEFLRERGGSRAIANLSYVADRRIEIIAHGLQVNPRSIVRVVKQQHLVAPGEAEEAAFRLISYLVGVAFGRWDVRIGRNPSLADVPDDLLAPPARYSPGMLLGTNGKADRSTPAGYPMELPTDGLLLDQPGHRWDIQAAVQNACRELRGLDEPLEDALGILMKKPSLRRFLRSQFFKRHLSMYSMSRRKAPIYWQLQVPSKNWGIWAYAPLLSREMFFAIVSEAEQRRRLATNRIRHLQLEIESGNRSRPAREVAKELDAEQRLAVELTGFHTKAEKIANLGWEPNLDDGTVLNAAPLAGLFPAWREAPKYRRELKAGKYQWATVSRYADQL